MINCPDERMPARMRHSRTALMQHEKFRAAKRHSRVDKLVAEMVPSVLLSVGVK
jgi:hypothetical protein